jgi:XFP-like protein
VRFIKVVDLVRLEPDTEHPPGLSDRDFDALLTPDTPMISAFHGAALRNVATDTGAIVTMRSGNPGPCPGALLSATPVPSGFCRLPSLGSHGMPAVHPAAWRH